MVDDKACADVAIWLQRIDQQADEAAFERLFHYYYPRLHQFLRCGGVDTAEIEELVQETLFKVWLKAGQYQPARGTPGSWIFTVARNVRSDNLRRAQGRMTQAALSPCILQHQPDMSESGAEAAAVFDRFDGLPQEQMAVLSLTHLEGLSQAEISRCLNVPLGTVKTRIRLAYRRLRRALEIDS